MSILEAVTDDIKKAIQHRLIDLNLDQKELANKMHVLPVEVSRALSPNNKQSPTVPKIWQSILKHTHMKLVAVPMTEEEMVNLETDSHA